MNTDKLTPALKERLLQLANEEFPAAARAGHYPIRLNHCFLRVVYDNLLGDKWQNVLAQGKPAIHQLTYDQLTAAIGLGERITTDVELLRELNQQSLRWRGKA